MHGQMYRVAVTIVFALVLMGRSISPAQAQLGIAAGLGFDSLSDIETTTDVSENATVDNATGYHLGVVYELGLGPVNLRPGLLYRKVGSYEFPNSTSDVTAWEVPVDVRISVLPVPLINPYLVGGPNAVFPRADVSEFDDELEDVSYTFNIGAGANISLPGVGLTLQPEVRYEFGATDYVNDEFEFGGTTFSPSNRKFSAFALRLHAIF